MDDVDRKLISALRHDARASLSDLAITLGVSRTTVRGRIERLQQSGEIVGFSVVLKGDAARDPVRGLMLIGIEGRGTDRIIRQLNGLSAALEEFDEVLARIRRFDGVATSETNLLLSTRKAANG
jgi:DNA-binding Lrp family transcriptional regulator